MKARSLWQESVTGRGSDCQQTVKSALSHWQHAMTKSGKTLTVMPITRIGMNMMARPRVGLIGRSGGILATEGSR